MANLINTLDLKKIEYGAKFLYEYDAVNKMWIGKVNNSDLVIVLKNKSKEVLANELTKALSMYCYMFSMEAIDKSLSVKQNASSKNTKPSCNILVPTAA